MNKTYRNIWNAATGTWTAVAETAKSHSKGTARAARQAVVALALGGASVGGAFAADACTTADGTSGTVDEAGVCQAPVALKGARSIGTTAALDDTVIKVGGTTAATISGNTSNIAIGSGASSYSDPANSPAIALGWNANSNGAGAVAIGSGSTASATEAVALGLRSTASGANSMTLGGDAKATEQNSIALGYRSEADRANAVSVGSATLQRQITNVQAGTQNTDAVNLGQMNTALATKVDNNYVKVNGTVDATATANGAIAIGSNAHADATGAAYPGVAIGMNSSAIGNSLAMGGGANAVSRGVAVGGGTTANVNGATAVGYIAGATADSATALGYSARAGNVKSLALGAGANVQNDGSVALGAGASTDRDNTVSVGSSTQQRQITNMAAGTAATDAVNVSQLAPVVTALGGGAAIDTTTGAVTGPTYNLKNGGPQTTVGGALGALDQGLTTANGNIAQNTADITTINNQLGDLASGTIGIVQQAGAGADITVGANTDGAAVDFTGTAGARKLTGVAAGDVSAASNEAINGSQLHGVSESVASAIGGTSTVNPDGTITAPSFTVGDGNGGTTTVHNVGDVVTNLDGRVTNNEGAITHLGDQLASGQIGLVQQDPATGTITVGANVGGSTVNFAGTGGARTLTGVANGVNDSDAVTIAQLKATGLIDYTGKEIAAVTYDDISLGSVTFGGSAGTALHNVAPGLIAAGSMDAVNGGQLHDLQQQFAQQYGQLSGQMNDLTNRVGDLETAGGGSGGGMGPGTGTGGDGSLVVGDGSNASGSNSTAVGQGAVASGDNGSAFGQGSNASGENSSAIGQGSVASGSDSTAIGQGSSATGNGSVALGQGSVADRDNAVSVGSAGNERQITNVADGTAPTDAVNVRQLDSAMQSVDQRFGETNRMINDVAKNAYAGVAAAMAMPNLTPSQPGKTVVAVGAANYKSGSAVAAGATYRTRDGKWLMNGALSVTSTGDAGVRAQVGYEF
ncbi:UNVERIFIED_ORG: autotransporter adhesin [Burkholderia territorii]